MADGWREHEAGGFEMSTTSGKINMQTATATLPATLALHFESAELGGECVSCNGAASTPTLRKQLCGMPLAAHLDADAAEWEIEQDTGRIDQHSNDDGSYRLTARVTVDLHPPNCPAQKTRIFPVYSATSPDGLGGAGPWLLRLEPETRKHCSCCAMPDTLAIGRTE